MIVSIQQPSYIPWLGLMHRIAISDLHVILDTCQFDRSGFNHRNKIRTLQGWQWLTLPVRHPTMVAIESVQIDTAQAWQMKHWKSLVQNYRNAPHFWTHARWLEEVLLGMTWTYLAQACETSLAWLLREFKIATPIAWTSRMELGAVRKSDLVLTICKEVGATSYLSGPQGRDYLDLAAFDQAGIVVEFHNYQHPVYEQVYPGFEPYMSAIDLLFNHGPKTKEILMGRTSEKEHAI